MDIRRMFLGGSEPNKVDSKKPQDFAVSKENSERLISLIPELLKYDYWSPEYQAWAPFIITAIGSGAYPKLAARYYAELISRNSTIGPVRNEMSEIYEELNKMNTKSSIPVFEDYMWSQIKSFEEHCRYYCDNYKALRKEIYKEEQSVKTMQLLLDSNEYKWDSLTAAIYLYRHCQVVDMKWSSEIESKLDEGIENWIDSFTKEWYKVVDFVEITTDVYSWYSESIKELILRAWRTSRDVSEGRKVISAQDVFQMPVWLSEQAVKYINNLPMTYDNPMSKPTIWNAYWQMFYTDEKEYSMSKAFWVLCVPKVYNTKFTDDLRDFCINVHNGNFVRDLISRKHTEWSRNPDKVDHPKVYAQELARRGFPVTRSDL